jgi:hypothetical protein
VLLPDPRMLPVSMANPGGISKRPLLLPSKIGIPLGSGTPAESGTPLGEDLLLIQGEVTLRSVHSVPVQHPAHHPWRDCTRLAIGGGQAHLATSSGTVQTDPIGQQQRRDWSTACSPQLGLS